MWAGCPHHLSMPLTPRRRFLVWVVCVAGILVGMPGWFFLLRGHRILDSDAILFSGWIVLSLLILLFWWLLRTTPPNAIKLPPGRSQWIIMLGAVWLHANAIVWLVPGLSDDALRYRRDGAIWLSLHSPYSFRPQNDFRYYFSWQFPESDWLDNQTPFPEVATVYLPTAQVGFVAIRWIENRLIPGPSQIWIGFPWRHYVADLDWRNPLLVWRVAFGLMMLVATWLIMRCCMAMGRSAWWAVLIGWHPLAIIETSGMAHQDAIGIMLLAAAFWAWLRVLTPSRGTPGELWGGGPSGAKPLTPTLSPEYTGEGDRPILSYSSLPVKTNRFALPAAGVLLALACGVKPLAILPAAFWFIVRPSARWVVPFIVTALLLASVLLYQDGYIGFFETLRTYTQQWEANGSFFHIIRTQLPPIWPLGKVFIEPWEYARMLGAIIVCTLAIGLVWKRAYWTTGVYWLVLASLLVAPVVYPWYLLWLLIIIPILSPRWGLTGLIFAATVTINYRLWHTSNWVLPWSWLAMEYVPVYLAMIVEIFFMRTKDAQPSPTLPTGKSLP